MPRLAFSKFYLIGQITDEHLCEMFEHQFMYGAREILLEYMQLSFDLLFCGVLQHGVGDPNTLWNNYPAPRINFKQSPIWLASESGRIHLKNKGVKRVYSTGSAWTYFKEISNNALKKQSIREDTINRRNILFFPDHGSWSVSAQYTHLKVNKTLSSLRRNFPNDTITICVYFTDFFSGDWQRVAEQYGMKVVCAGNGVSTPVWSLNPGRIYFFDRLKEFYNQHDVALFESYSSGIFYALSEGLPVMLFPNQETMTFNHSKEITEEFRSSFPEIAKDFSYNFRLKNYASEILGDDSKLSPELLMTLLKPRRVGILSKEYNEFERDSGLI